jgi:hypothetical protein
MMRLGQYNSNPNLSAEDRARLSGEYSFWTGILEDILIRKPKIWNDMRVKHKSDKACDKEFEATDDGINEVVIRLKLKRIEKLISALSTLIRIAEGNARNQY